MADTHGPTKPDKKDLTKGDTLSHLRRLSLPMTWGIFAVVSVTLMDTYYISRLGTEELAAISFAFTISFSVFSLILGLGVGMSSVISRTIGAGNMLTVRRIVLHSLITGFLFSLALTVLGLTFQPLIFRMMGADEALMPYILEYMNIWFLGIAFVTLPIIGNAAMRGNGDSMTPSLIMIMVAVLNLILDPILIFGYLGAPAMGMQGAALASVISYAISMIVGLVILYKSKRLLGHAPADWHLFADSAKKLLHVGLPAGLANMVQPLSQAVVVALLAHFGTQAVAGFGVAVRVQAFVLIPLMALATGMAPIIGQNWGAGFFERVNEIIRKALQLNIIWCCFIALMLAIFARQIAGLFSSEPDVIQVTALYFYLVPLTFIGAQTVSLWGAAFNAAGYPKRAFLNLNGKILIFYIPGAWIGGLIYGFPGTFAGIAIANIMAGVIFHLANRHFCLKKENEIAAESR